MPPRRGLKVSDVNPHLVCSICDGYLIDATTVIECLHSFCRTCIVQYLETSNFCPVCEVQVHKTRPLLSIRSDQTLQGLVYKMVPGLYQNEMQQRREFYSQHPESADLLMSTEERGESDPRFFSLQECISLSLHHRSKDSPAATDNSESKDPTTRHLSCPAGFTVGHVKKFLRFKFSLPTTCHLDIFYDEHLLVDDWSLMDVAYIYLWKRASPMNFFYTISKRAPKIRELPLPSPVTESVSCSEMDSIQVTQTGILEMEPGSSVELQNADAELEKMDVDPVIETPDPVVIDDAPLPEPVCDTSKEQVLATSKAPVMSDLPEPAPSSKNDDQKMEVEEVVAVKSNSSPIHKSIPPPLPIPEPTYNSVKLVSAPENNTLLSPTNGFRLKFIHDPELNPKSQKSKKEQKKSGRKGGRSSRYKSVPVRLARLAPYPPPPVPATCLTTQPLQHLPQITMGKLLPTVITTLANTIVTALVSTTSNTLCNVTHKSNAKHVASFLTQPTSNVSTVVNNFVPIVSKTVSESSHLQSSTLTSTSEHMNGVASASTLSLDKDSLVNTKELPNIIPSTCAILVSPSASTLSAASAVAVHLKLPDKDSPKLGPPIALTSTTGKKEVSSIPVSSPLCIPSSTNSGGSKSQRINSIDSSLTLNDPSLLVTRSSNISTHCESVTSISVEAPSVNTVPSDVILTCDKKAVVELTKKDPVTNDVMTKNNDKIELTLSNSKSSIFKNSIDEYSEKIKEDRFSESFKIGVKNSISAEFSDNDDLGCQPDLVVDEQKMDSSDNEDDNSDAALRKKITAIAEKEDEIDVTDDIEVDSGISCAARSEDDIDSPKSSVPGTSIVTVPCVSIAPSSVTTSSTEDSSQRHIKSNNIHDVIKNLYRQHEIGRPASTTSQSKLSSLKQASAKCDNGALDLSICIRKPDEVHTRQKTVANPVLDIKHRQQAYLPAPTNTNKQHTVCPPAPKHNSSSQLLSHLTSSNSSILHAQLTGSAKSPHHQSSSYVPNVPFSLPSSGSNRPASTPSPLSGRATPNSYGQKLPPGTGYLSNTNLLPNMIPMMYNNFANYASRNNMSMNLPLPNRTLSNSHQKDIPSVSIPSNKLPYNKPVTSFSARKTEFLLNSNAINGRGSGMSTPSLVPPHPRTSQSMVRMSPHHRSASPAPSPQHVTQPKNSTASIMVPATTSSQSKPSVPIYKKQDSFKTYNHKFKGSSNLAVFNPDPNGFQNKLVIKKLDSQPNNHH